MPQHTLPAFPFLFSFLQQYCTVADHCPVSLILLNLVDCCCDCRCRSGINDNIIDISIEHILYCQRTTLISYAFCRKSREIPVFASFNIILSCCAMLICKAVKKNFSKKTAAVIGAAAFAGAVLAVIVIARTPMPL